jgi:hypothetical protein
MIAFHKEARYHETVQAGVQRNVSAHRHRHVLKRGEDILATMDTSWRPIQ